MGRKRQGDFQKVKLKVGRQIQKATNVTPMNFKSKRITIRSQLTRQSSSVKVPLDELLKQLNRYSPTAKIDAINCVKDRILAEKDLFLNYLVTVVDTVSPIIIDKEYAVRNSVLNLLTIIFKSASNAQLETVFPVIFSYLNCASTHIDISIRQDSLKLLDLILDVCPNLICFSRTPLNNFLELISCYNKNQRSDAPSRSLTTTPDEASQEWRIQVLERLAHFFKSSSISISKEENKTSTKVVETFFDGTKPLYLPFYQFEDSSVQSSQSTCNILQHDRNIEPDFVQSFVSNLMPLLFGIWTETAPNFAETSDVTLSPEEATSMACVLRVICCLTEWIQLIDARTPHHKLMHWFIEKASKNVQDKFLTSFPYSQHSRPHARFAKRIKTSDKACLLLNLDVCESFTALVFGTDNCNDTYKTRCLEYLLLIIQREEFDKVHDMASITRILKVYLSVEEDLIQEHMIALFELYQHLDYKDKTRKHIMEFFSDIVLEFKYKHLMETTVLKRWLENLAEEFIACAEENDVLVNVAKQAAVRGYRPFLAGLQEHVLDIIELLKVDDESLQNAVTTLIAKIEYVDEELYYKFIKVFREPTVAVRSISLILQQFCHRLLKSDPGIKPSDFVNFLFCIISGVTPNEENSWIGGHSDLFFPLMQSVPFEIGSYTIVPGSLQCDRHERISMVAIRIFAIFPNKDILLMALEFYITGFLERVKSMPVHTAAALLNFCMKLCPTDFTCGFRNQAFSRKLMDLTLSILLYETALADIRNNEKERRTMSIMPQMEIWLRELKNVGCILELITDRISVVQSVESAIFLCNLLIQIHDLVPLKDEDKVLFNSVLQTLKIQFGEAIEKQFWWKKVSREFSQTP